MTTQLNIRIILDGNNAIKQLICLNHHLPRRGTGIINPLQYNPNHVN